MIVFIISIFCSGLHGLYPFCFSTAIWHKCCFLFLFYHLYKLWGTVRCCKHMCRNLKFARYHSTPRTPLCIFKWYTCNAWVSFPLYATSGSIIAMILMDKLGRKVLLLGSFSGMVSSKRTQKYLLKNGRRPTKDMYSEHISCLGSVLGPSSNCSKFLRIGIWGIVPICWWHASVSC